MKRDELVELLDDVVPTLNAVSMTPALSHFWFTGKRLMTYDGFNAISVPCKTDFVGMVPQTILALLKSSRAADVEMSDDGKHLTVFAGRSKFKLVVMFEEPNDIFEMPDYNPTSAFPVDAQKFLQAIESCTYSLGNDTSKGDHLGVTLLNRGDHLLLFSTDSITMSYGSCKLEKGVKLGFDRVILNTLFCYQLLRICKGADQLQMKITDKYSMVKHGGRVLHGALKEVDANPLDFEGLLKREYPETPAHKMIKMAGGALEGMLDRACIISNDAVDKAKTQITIADKNGERKMHFYSDSERGNVRDSMTIEGGHSEVVSSFDPEKMRTGYGRFDKMLVTKTAVVMTKGHLVYVISAAA